MNSYHVYVIELRPTPVRSENREEPRYSRKGDVYVGSSGLPPRQRLEHHKVSPRGSRHVKKRGLRLRPDLYRGLGPFRTREEAKEAEHRLAHKLSREGYNVYGACSKRHTPECIL